MDKLINFLLLIICVIILFTLFFNKENIERFGFSENDVADYHNFIIDERRHYNIFTEDNNLVLNSPRLNNPLRDVKEMMNYDSDAKDIYELTKGKKEISLMTSCYTSRRGFFTLDYYVRLVLEKNKIEFIKR